MASLQKYLVKTLNGMAIGLFASLIIGLILKQIGQLAGISHIITFGTVAQYLMGPAIGAATANSVKAPPLGIFACVAVGAIGAGSISIGDGGAAIIRIGEPLGAFVAALAAAEVSKLIAGKTKLDILLVPAITILVGGFIGFFLSPYIAEFMKSVGAFINFATELQPIPMGIIISVVMGVILTLPISSAAIAISLGLSGLAGGASLVGCCCQMIGFAVISHRVNGVGGTIAQGLGTSMLQIPNIIKNPRIWIPAIFASAVLGPIATTIGAIQSNSIGAGMGTSGLVGQFGAYAAMIPHMRLEEFLIRIGLMNFLLPAFLAYGCFRVMEKAGWIKSNDLKIDLKQ
ncbi:MAG: PTS sugar transporter subunit IIC [Bacillota bacterium]|nr:PTS sugar transporter subunit IIC [Bacillota bacterium]